MEQALDDIAGGKADYRAVISEAHTRLEQELRAFAKATGKVREKCGKPMVHRVKKPGNEGKAAMISGVAPAGRGAKKRNNRKSIWPWSGVFS